MGDSKRENFGTIVAVYGCPPPEPTPRIGDGLPTWPSTDFPFPLPDPPRPFAPTPTQPLIVRPQLLPCTICGRHIVAGTECPFCFATARAKAAEDSADAELLEALDRWIKNHHAITWHGKLIRRAAERLRER